MSIVFNSAATIKFDEELKDAIDMNVKGPMQLLEICRKMKRLEVHGWILYAEFLNIATLNYPRLLCTCLLLSPIYTAKK